MYMIIGNKKKSGRVWDTSKVTTEAMNALDMSKRIEGGTSSEEEEGLEAARRTYLPSDDDDSVIVDGNTSIVISGILIITLR